MSKSLSSNLAMIQKLRTATAAPIAMCKKALEDAGGNFDLALQKIRESGAARAEKRSVKEAAEGIVVYALSEDGKVGCIAEINSETDFAARNSAFKDFANVLVAEGLRQRAQNPELLLDSVIAEGESANKTLEDLRIELVAKIGENIRLRRVRTIVLEGNGVISAYSHGGGRIVALVALNKPLKALASELALHVVAIPQEMSAAASIPEGFYEQNFVKDPSQTLSQLISAQDPEARVSYVLRFEVGEGIQKEVIDFAREVKAQLEQID
eukprot:TRINITY_DN13324_c0_g1_i1.p1 TRINITY_DN13324_c0_g1~~TRINITY_DN13324_c0_g1_i1.p1  ORF type:complete len:268 (+),score=-22.76 TRINITY_DN13324_c0_g1_i1:902-1705(+)